MDARLQRRIQRYGWDLAAADYDALWGPLLAVAHRALLERAALEPGQRVLDVACGTGLVTLAASDRVGPRGRVSGVDLSGRMVECARARTRERAPNTVDIARMDAESLDFPDEGFDVALCAFGLMYMPNPEKAISEIFRTLRPGGRLVVTVWGTRERCAWSTVFPIVDAEVASDVCPLFFRLGASGALESAFVSAGHEAVDSLCIPATLTHADAQEACDAALVAGPMALAWSRFDDSARQRVKARYLDTIEAWRSGCGYALPSEFILVSGQKPADPAPMAGAPVEPAQIQSN